MYDSHAMSVGLPPSVSGNCEVTYTRKKNSHVEGGTLQEGLTSLSDCKRRCGGNGLKKGATCYGFDYDHQTRTCYVLLKEELARKPTLPLDGVDHYTKASNRCGQETSPTGLSTPATPKGLSTSGNVGTPFQCNSIKLHRTPHNYNSDS